MGEVNLEQLGVTKEEFDSLSPEEQQKLALEQKPDKDAPPAPKEDDKEKAIKGILADLQKERGEKRELKDRLEEMESRMQNLTSALEKAGNKEEGLEVNDEDYLNVKTARKLLEREVKSMRDEMGNYITHLESKFIAATEKETASKYSSEKVGEELSYDKVIEEGLKPLLKESPELKIAIRRSANPSEAAYKLGLTHPKFTELLATKKAQEVVDKLTKEKPKTGGGGGGSAGGFSLKDASVDDLLKLSDEELDKLAKKA